MAESSLQRKKPVTYGSKEEVADNVSLTAAKSIRIWYLYVGNLSLRTTLEKVEEYLRHNGVISVSCEEIPNLNWIERHSNSMHVNIKYKDKDKVMSSSFWDRCLRETVEFQKETCVV